MMVVFVVVVVGSGGDYFFCLHKCCVEGFVSMFVYGERERERD